MQTRFWKTCVWAFLWISTSSAIASCSQSPTSSAQPSQSSQVMQGMDHGSMSMDLGPADADFDLRFIDAMTPHHQGAIDMSKEAKQKSKRPEIQKLAATILQEQTREISKMKQWRQAWYPKASSTPMAYHAQMGHMMPMSSKQIQGMKMSQDLGAADAQFDARFVKAMIPHHEGAVVMAKEALKKSKRSEIKKLAESIISSQQAEIAQMKRF